MVHMVLTLAQIIPKVMLLELVIVLVLGLIIVIGKQMFLLISLILTSILMELV